MIGNVKNNACSAILVIGFYLLCLFPTGQKKKKKNSSRELLKIYLPGNLTSLKSYDDNRFGRGQHDNTKLGQMGHCSAGRDATLVTLLEINFD